MFTNKPEQKDFFFSHSFLLNQQLINKIKIDFVNLTNFFDIKKLFKFVRLTKAL